MRTHEEIKAEYDQLDQEAGKYNRREFDEVYTIIADLTQDREDVGDRGNLALPLASGEVVDEALKRAGYAEDQNFAADFKEYRKIEQKARELQLELELASLLINEMQCNEDQPANEWRFVPITIIAPQPIAQIMGEIITTDATEGKGLFANFTEIPSEDETEDGYLMIDAYGVKCSLTPFWDDLKRYNVIGKDGFLCDEFRRCLLFALSAEANFIKDNTTAPAKVKNHIAATMGVFGEMPVWGLFFQMLLLQGLCRWLEGINIDEGDSGYNDAQSLYDWIVEQLALKELEFCYKPYGKKDRERLKPLCDYLYSTEAGRLVQAFIFDQDEENADTVIPSTAIPKELDTPQFKAILDKAVAAGFVAVVGGVYRWSGTSPQLAYFAEQVSNTLQIKPKFAPFQNLFGTKNLAQERYKSREYTGKVDGQNEIDCLIC